MFPRSFRARFAFALTSLVLLGAPAIAGAAGEKDAEAMKLHDQAMDEDYLAVEFDKAEKKLKDALKKCGKDGCTEKVLGKLHVALGTVYGGAGKLDQAKEEFVAALKADPKAALIDALTTPELAKAFKDAQKEAGGGAKPAAPSGETPAETPGETPTAKKPEGDMAHTPIAEQAVNTPVPIYIEIPDEVGAAKVSVRYKPFGSKKWKSAEMKEVGDGWGVEIPCEDVTTTGDIKYYIIAKDEAGDPVGTAGSLKAPYKVPIKNEIDEAPSLPGRKPPQKCAAKEDCPPGLPGCPSGKKGEGEQRGDKPWGSSCEESRECSSGLICLNGTCEEGTETGGGEEKPSTGKKNLVGLWGQFDLLLINGKETGVCTGEDPSYTCFYPDGSEYGEGQFYGQPADVTGTNGIQGGFAVGGARVLLSYDRLVYQITPKIALNAGLRLGYAFGGSPSSESGPPQIQAAVSPDIPTTQPQQAKGFLPFHAEARATVMFGDSVLTRGKILPFAFLGGGLAQVNASVPVSVCDYREPDGTPVQTGTNQGSCVTPAANSRVVKNLDAYQITGLNFIGVGGGAIYGITDQFGVAAELKVMFMFTTFGVVFAPNIGPVFAF